MQAHRGPVPEELPGSYEAGGHLLPHPQSRAVEMELPAPPAPRHLKPGVRGLTTCSSEAVSRRGPGSLQCGGNRGGMRGWIIWEAWPFPELLSRKTAVGHFCYKIMFTEHHWS